MESPNASAMSQAVTGGNGNGPVSVEPPVVPSASITTQSPVPGDELVNTLINGVPPGGGDGSVDMIIIGAGVGVGVGVGGGTGVGVGVGTGTTVTDSTSSGSPLSHD
jgi:hypothetical protein